MFIFVLISICKRHLMVKIDNIQYTKSAGGNIMEVGNEIKRLRVNLDLSQDNLADKIFKMIKHILILKV